MAAASILFGMGLAKWNMLPYRAVLTIARTAIGLDTDRPRPAVNYYVRRTDQFDRLPGGADVLVIGDSLVEQGEWNELLAPLAAHNRGIGNDTVYGLSLRMAQTCRHPYKTGFLMIGVNDALNGFLKAISPLVTGCCFRNSQGVPHTKLCTRSSFQIAPRPSPVGLLPIIGKLLRLHRPKALRLSTSTRFSRPAAH